MTCVAVTIIIIITAIILSFIFLVLTFLITVYHSYCIPTDADLDMATQTYKTNPIVSNIVISFTTMPKRLQSKSIQKVIESMLTQTYRPQEIRLHVPYKLKKTGEEYHIPQWLTQVPVTVVRCKDYGPATKHIPVLEHFYQTNPSQHILIYDDDSVMPQNTLETYMHYQKQYPGTALTAHGILLNRRPDGSIMNDFANSQAVFGKSHWVVRLFGHYIYRNMNLLTPEHSVHPVDVLEAMAGYCVQPKMFHSIKDLSDYDPLPREAFFVDDIVIGALLARNEIPMLVLYDLEMSQMTREDTMNYIKGILFGNNKEALFSVNHDYNNWNTTIAYFEKDFMKLNALNKI